MKKTLTKAKLCEGWTHDFYWYSWKGKSGLTFDVAADRGGIAYISQLPKSPQKGMELCEEIDRFLCRKKKRKKGGKP
jgi:hypothetical protein